MRHGYQPVDTGAARPKPPTTGSGVKPPTKTVENPKAAAGRAKVNMGAIPPVSILYLAAAHDLGATKYGVANWRDKPIRARDYVAPLMRHLTQWASGEDLDVGESELPHLAMLMATASVLLDAWTHGALIDDRIQTPEFTATMRRIAELKKTWPTPRSA